MERLASSPNPRSADFGRKWVWALGVILAVAVVFAVVFGIPRLVAVYQLYFGRESIQRLFHDELGFSQAWSSFIGVVGQFFYALAWVPLTLWTFRVLAWRYSNRQFAVAFASWVFVYGHVPLMHALLGSDACFNQRTGAPMKWFVQDADGRIVLFDSPGYDTVTRVEKRPVTPEICAAFAKQKVSARPRKITADIRDIEFFDPSSGRARVWYSKASDGSFNLFDSRGYHPATGESLLPVGKEVVAEIMTRAARDAEDARKGAANAPAAKISAAPASAPMASTSAECPGGMKQFTIGSEWVNINPGRKCRVVGRVQMGKVIFRGSAGVSPSIGPEGGGWMDMIYDDVRAASDSAQLLVGLCPLQTAHIRNVGWDCKPL